MSWRDLAIDCYRELALGTAKCRLSKAQTDRDLSQVAIVTPTARANGITAGARMQYERLRSEGFDARFIDASASPASTFRKIPHGPATSYIIHSAAPETPMMIHQVLPTAASSWRIGYWAWELPIPPSGWRRCEPMISEIWTPSTFSAAALRPIFSVPIRVVPHRIKLASARSRNFDGPFTVLAMADSRSSFVRKNPAGALEAFRMAFGDRTDCRMILKLSGHDNEIADLVRKVRLSANIRIVRHHLNRQEMDSLYRSADAFLSMHRSEGFGLPLLEAMARGLPVVATGWSGNIDFMNSENSVLVPYNLVPVQDNAGVYRNQGGVWAEPDVDAAANALRTLAAGTSDYSELADRAHRAAVEWSTTKIGPDIRAHL